MTRPDSGSTPDDLARDDQTQPDALDELDSGLAEVRTGDADRVSEDETGNARPADQNA